MSRIAPILALLAAMAIAQPAYAVVTPFGQEVHDAIEEVVQFFRNQAGPDGSMGNPRALGLPVLCMLEKRQSADFFAAHVGYGGMDEDDQDIIRAAVRHIINNDPAFTAGANPYSYGTGNKLMALSLYKATEGPDDVGAQVEVTAAIENGVRALKNSMGRRGCNVGGWNYGVPQDSGDLSTAQFAIAGLAAAVSVVDDAADDLVMSPDFLANSQNADGGHKYRSCGNQASSHAMTASGLWCYRLAGVAASDERAQQSLTWLRDRYQYDRQENWWQNSFYYYLWAAAKALAVSKDDAMLPDGVFSEDVGGVRDPDDDGFPGEEPGWYYDFAYLLLQEQANDGSWPSRARPPPSQGSDMIADAAFACLVLERSLGGICLDLDEDGLCEMEDNCAEHFNPDQQDSDFDGVGDACDNCRLNPNIGQEDVDGDGVGDECDKLECTPTNDRVEICDGLDNDCDGVIDNIDGIGQICATGDPGVCAMGRMGCVAGEILCRPVHQGSRQEVCDLLDNDCDGLIDEELLNECGFCGEAALDEQCNGLDDNCDGIVDNGARCEGGRACIAGECAARCEAGECVEDGYVCSDGYCQSPCAGVQCEAGLRCDIDSGDCLDRCDDMACDAGLICVLGQCGSCSEVGCPAGRVCDGVVCIGDPCADVNCSRGEFCRQGECMDSCAQLSCPLRQSCLDGRCVPDPCGGVVCFAGLVCIDGECDDDPCFDNRACEAQGLVCVPGRDCIEDPCVGVTCKENQRCEPVCNDAQADCDARCVGDWLPGGPPIVQDFCDPESPIFDEELCNEVLEGEGEDEGFEGGNDFLDPEGAEGVEGGDDVGLEGDEGPNQNPDAPPVQEGGGELGVDDTPGPGPGGDNKPSCNCTVTNRDGGAAVSAPWMVLLMMLGVGVRGRR